MKHDELREWMSASIDGELPEDQQARLDEVLAGDTDLREEFEELRRTVAHLRELDEIDPPSDLLAGVRQRLDAAPWRGRIIHWIGLPQARLLAAAAMLLIVVRFGFEIDRTDPSPRPVSRDKASVSTIVADAEVEAPAEDIVVATEIMNEAGAFGARPTPRTSVAEGPPGLAEAPGDIPFSPAPVKTEAALKRDIFKAFEERKSIKRTRAEEGRIWEDRASAAAMAIDGPAPTVAPTDDDLDADVAPPSQTRSQVQRSDAIARDLFRPEPKVAAPVGKILPTVDELSAGVDERAERESGEQKSKHAFAKGLAAASPAPQKAAGFLGESSDSGRKADVAESGPDVPGQRTIQALTSETAVQARKDSAHAMARRQAAAMPRVIVLEVAGPDVAAITGVAQRFRVAWADNTGTREIAAGHARVDYAASRVVAIGSFDPTRLGRLIRALSEHGECHLSRIDGKKVTDAQVFDQLTDRVTVLVVISVRESPTESRP